MHRIVRVRLFTLLALPLVLLASDAEQLSLQQAIDQAVQMNPQVRIADDRVISSTGQKTQAGLKPNPRVVIQQENGRAWEFNNTPQRGVSGDVFFRDTDTYLYGAQLIERGGKRERRVEVASAGVNRARSERDMVVQQLKARVAIAYWNAVSMEKIRALYEEELHTLDRIVQDTQNRVREGATAGADLLRMQVERERLSAAVQNAELDADRARIALLREIGRTEFPKLAFTDPIDAPITAVEEPIEQVFAQRAEIEAAKDAVSQAQSNVRLQLANAKGDTEVQLGYKRTAGYDTLYTALNIQLPIRNRNQGNIATAEADLHAAESSLSAVQQQIRAEIALSRRDYESKQRIVSETLKPLAARSDEALRITLGAYQQGGFDLLRYLDALRVQIEDQIMLYQGLGQAHQSAVALQQAQGDFQ
jgi:cobalt-zinc-cadmium efflux system outer membrane protein